MTAPPFDGRVAVVSGASRGMGEAVARRLAADGARVVLMAAPVDADAVREVSESLADAGHEVRTQVGDIREPATSSEAVGQAMSSFGRLDYLVNNAGIYPERELFDETPDFYDLVVGINLDGLRNLTDAAVPVMTAPGGAITCTASTCSLRAIERFASYNISKGAVLHYTRALAAHLAPRGIRVNAVAPGVISATATDVWTRQAAVWSKQRSRIPMDRIGLPHEVAAVTAFLLSERASYMTGATVIVDGGESAGWRDSDWLAEANGDFMPRLRSRPNPPSSLLEAGAGLGATP